jgi:DnaK suppressor protein
MTKSELNSFRSALEKFLTELENGSGSREPLAIETSPDELDRIQHAAERDLAIGNLERDYTLMRHVQGALRRIHTETFGICLNCADEISLKRLRAVPWAPACIVCQEAAERMQRSTRSKIDAPIVIAA